MSRQASLPGAEQLAFSAPFQPHSEASREAAKSVEPSAASVRGRILWLLRRTGPLTDEVIQFACALNPSTERPRRIELVRLGLVEDSGQTAPTKSGRKAVLWRAAFHASAAVGSR